ncbi:MAG: Transcriptional regulator, IclR family [uncultured Thermomicrobiales bacterium]|uniref:Transcriptional regulator, IclR family n=1 Tax=uncultured Thermomicrobiales bacterium TaxID=1645740 RepID=A0A6J4VEV0_9BACT|nr:MAG: Transcriptional regulator, IclR family [uncultured Thermomicrobiales bacterium]
MATDATKYRIDSVSHAAEILCAFLRPPHRFGLTELTDATGLTKNQAFRMLRTLEPAGFVVQDGATKTYRLGSRIVDLAAFAVHGTGLVHAAAPVLDAVAAETGETVNLITRLDDRSAICVDTRDSRQRLRITASVGARFALHAGASPKLLLAFSPRPTIAAYLRDCAPFPAFTAKTITDPAPLLAELDRIGARGYAVSNEEIDKGICSIAAPVRDGAGAVIAGVSVAAPTIRSGPDDRQRNTDAVLAAARRISAQLAGTDPDGGSPPHP